MILTYTPYAALNSLGSGEEMGERNITDTCVPRGFARALFHLVGTGNSVGCYDYGVCANAIELKGRSALILTVLGGVRPCGEAGTALRLFP